MICLAIDTATNNPGIALRDGDGPLAAAGWRTQRNHSVELLPNLERLMAPLGVSLGELRGIAVSLGPGSYNGLRVGISTAKGLAYALDIPLVGIGTLKAAAWSRAAAGLPVTAFFSAAGGEYAAATYHLADGELREVEAPHLAGLAEIIAGVTETTIFCGEIGESEAAQLRAALGGKARLAAPVDGGERAGALAELGIKRLEAGEGDNIASLSPVYLRPPPITKPKRGRRKGETLGNSAGTGN